jgi:hypothetical protein
MFVEHAIREDMSGLRFPLICQDASFIIALLTLSVLLAGVFKIGQNKLTRLASDFERGTHFSSSEFVFDPLLE